MANISNATPAQLAQLSQFVVTLRALTGNTSINLNRMNALMEQWAATISAIIGTPAGLTVTDTSGLAGITPLTDTQVQQLVSVMQTLVANLTTANQQLFVLAAGPTNTVG